MKKLRESRVRAILNDDSIKCFLFNGIIVKNFEAGKNVSIVVDVKGNRFEVGTKHLKEVSPCIHEALNVPKICFKEKDHAGECKKRFCLHYKSCN
ncbi:MAG: hypothetical protein WCI91_03960 [Candidatus Nomurabacteria bacterium]